MAPGLYTIPTPLAVFSSIVSDIVFILPHTSPHYLSTLKIVRRLLKLHHFLVSPDTEHMLGKLLVQYGRDWGS